MCSAALSVFITSSAPPPPRPPASRPQPKTRGNSRIQFSHCSRVWSSGRKFDWCVCVCVCVCASLCNNSKAVHEEDLHSEVVHEEDEILLYYIQNLTHCSRYTRDAVSQNNATQTPTSVTDEWRRYFRSDCIGSVATVRLICDGCHYQQSMRSVSDSGDHSAGPVRSHHALA